eukprot:3507246-Rhodomonas_salina.1
MLPFMEANAAIIGSRALTRRAGCGVGGAGRHVELERDRGGGGGGACHALCPLYPLDPGI